MLIGAFYILTHLSKFFLPRGEGKMRDAGAKYGGKRLDGARAETIVRRTKALLASQPDLSDARIDPRRLARLLGLPYYLLSRVVNECCGVSIGVLIRDARIARAKALLEREDAAKILDIALDSGFSAKSSFNAAFKEVVGMSPTEYRRRCATERGEAP